MSYNNFNSYKSDNSFIENRKLNINNNLYKDFCFWVNNHTNLSDCILKISNFMVLFMVLLF